MIDENISFAEASKRRKENEKTYKLTKNKTYNILIPSNAKSVANFFVLKLKINSIVVIMCSFVVEFYLNFLFLYCETLYF